MITIALNWPCTAVLIRIQGFWDMASCRQIVTDVWEDLAASVLRVM
jgi:hypothetical protein